MSLVFQPVAIVVVGFQRGRSRDFGRWIDPDSSLLGQLDSCTRRDRAHAVVLNLDNPTRPDHGGEMIRDILVHLDGTGGGERRLAYALALAVRHDARLTVLHVTPPVDVPPRYKPSVVGRAAKGIEHKQIEDARLAESLYKSAAVRSSVPVRWRATHGGMSSMIATEARCADLVVLGQYEAEGAPEHHPLSLAAEVVLACGGPVLVVPADIPAGGSVGRALVAWDGSREAVRAVHDAIPLLLQSDTETEIVIIDEGVGSGGAEALIDHLSRHRVRVAGSAHLHSKGSDSRALMSALEAGRFNLLVMGAYGHPVWLETLFGGTTQTALINASMPILMSH
jgi:nucleotide-binding universal stress UspA family protein